MKQTVQDFKIERFLPYRMNIWAEEMSRSLSALYQGRYQLAIVHWRIMVWLYQAGALRAQDISVKTGVDKSQISRAVSALEVRGFVHREADSNDRRSTTLSLTAAGQALMQELLPDVLEWESSLLSVLSDAEYRQMLEIFTKLDARLAEMASEAH